MAISPTVNQYMDQNQQGPQTAEQLFLNQFSTQAYNALRAKFPGIVNFVTTFKTLYSDIEEGSAFGTFIVSKGKDILYVPVTMSDGTITSCEMGYDKGSDQFFPLNDDTIKSIIAENNYSDPTILQHNVPVEDTRTMMHNLIRPPVSSNVVLASGGDGISALPNRYKAALSTYLSETDPALLAKIAKFYDVEELAHKLAPTAEKTAARQEPVLPAFLRLDTLTKEAARQLASEERAEILKTGYLIRGDADKAPILVADRTKLAAEVESLLRVYEYPGGDSLDRPEYTPKVAPTYMSRVSGGISVSPVFCANLAQLGKDGITFEHVLVAGDVIIGKHGRRHVDKTNKVLISDCHCGTVEPMDGLVSVGQLNSELAKHKTRYVHLDILVPVRNDKYVYIEGHTVFDGSAEQIYVTSSSDGRTEIIVKKYNDEINSICVNPEMSKGYLIAGNTLAVPKDARFLVYCHDDEDKPLAAIDSLDTLRKNILVLGTSLRTIEDGAGITVDDESLGKSASFANRAEAAAYLHDKYAMTQAQAVTALATPRTVVFHKHAFDSMGAYALPPEQQPAAPAPEETGSAMEMPNDYAQDLQPQPDFQALNDFATLEDADLLDAGILSSFAQYPDVKGMLLEYLPDFLTAQDKVGRILLLFSYRKKEVEDVYGPEKYAATVGACRKIFSLIGTIVAALKTYVNMA